MFRDPTTFADDLDALEDMERASLRLVAQALAVFGKEAREIFAGEKDHEGDIGEDITREALDSLGVSKIPVRIFGKMDYKRARYVFHPQYAVRQALLVDSKSEKDLGTATLQTSQTSMRIRHVRAGNPVDEPGKLPAVMTTSSGESLLTTTIFAKYFYESTVVGNRLKTIRVACVPNLMLQAKYNPTAIDTIWRTGRNAPSLGEEFRVRLVFDLLKQKASWRVQDIEIDPQQHFAWAE